MGGESKSVFLTLFDVEKLQLQSVELLNFGLYTNICVQSVLWLFWRVVNFFGEMLAKV